MFYFGVAAELDAANKLSTALRRTEIAETRNRTLTNKAQQSRDKEWEGWGNRFGTRRRGEG